MTLLAQVVAASDEVAGTTARSAKVATLARLLRGLDPTEVPVVVGFLAGSPRQGRVGVGYAAVYGVEVPPAAEPTLTVAELDEAIARIETTTGAGSTGERRAVLE